VHGGLVLIALLAWVDRAAILRALEARRRQR
jgi:hypothetical protein